MRILPLALLAAVLLCAVTTACEDEKRYYVRNIGNGDSVPTMSTTDVRTFISDSGYTKYYITAPIWDMYEEAADPYWMFPRGVELEQYDKEGNPTATLTCDTARYLSQKRVWQLDRNIVMVNVRRDTFLTNQVFWDQQKHTIYSDSFIHIVQADRVIEGYGFQSNENMTSYTVNRPTGIFPVQDQRDAVGAGSTDNGDGYGDDMDRRRAPAPQRASERSTQMFHFEPIPYNPSSN